MKLKIYGSGCAKCNLLANHAASAAQSLGLSYELEKITDVNDIIDAGIMRTPALVVDDEVLVEGNVASEEKIQQLLAQSAGRDTGESA